MNPAHLHLLVNHLPIIGAAFAVGLGFFAYLKKSADLSQATLWLLLVVGAGTGAAMWTGNEAEDVVEKLPGVSRQAIHEHEEAAEFARYAGLGSGLFALVLLARLRGRPESHRNATVFALFMAVLTLALMARTGYLGGFIRHPEIGGATASPTDTDED
jgi:uncharacterized membrane protein